MKTFVMSLLRDEEGTAVTEWVVAASIMAMAGIATFAAIGSNVQDILGQINTQVQDLRTSVDAGAGGGGGG
jgi:Flp pilus assembly pilin Flp